jgi:hypothetical protein
VLPCQADVTPMTFWMVDGIYKEAKAIMQVITNVTSLTLGLRLIILTCDLVPTDGRRLCQGGGGCDE